MQQSFLGLVFNITVLILEYKRSALAQTFSLGYKPLRPNYFYPDHPGHHPPQIISEGWLWPEDPNPPCTTSSTTTPTTTTTTTARAIVEVPNRRPDLPNLQGSDGFLDPSISPEINHWFRPIIITNAMSTDAGSEKKTSTSSTAAPTTTRVSSTTSTSTQAPSTLAGSPQVQFLPEGDLFTSAPVGKKQVISSNKASSERPKTAMSTEASSVATPPTILETPEGNVTLAVADLLPLPELVKNGSAENINLLLPVLPLKALKDNDIN